MKTFKLTTDQKRYQPPKLNRRNYIKRKGETKLFGRIINHSFYFKSPGRLPAG